MPFEKNSPSRLRFVASLVCCAAQVVIGAAVLRAEHPAPPTKPVDFALAKSKEVQPSRVVVYKHTGHNELQLHTFLPEGWKAGDKRPCFLAIHGGGWVAGTPKIMYCVTDYVARRGWVGLSVQYRLHRPDAGTTVFDSIRDVRSAVHYLRSHANELGIDPAKIVVGGRSAGGHLAASTVLFGAFDEPHGHDPHRREGRDHAADAPAALVLFSPVIDTSADGYGKDVIGDRWRDVSPLHHVRGSLPPTIVLHGVRDSITPYVGAKAFVEAMQRAGNRCELVSHADGNHSYMMRTPELFEDAMAKTMAFLKAAGIEAPAKEQ